MRQVIVEKGDPDEVLDAMKAQEVLESLCKHYPFHPWGVSWQGRVLVVRHAEISNTVKTKLGRDGFGFVLKHLNSYSASDLARNAVMAGGTMLEAFGFKRGAWDGSEPQIPSTFKPRQPETFN